MIEFIVPGEPVGKGRPRAFRMGNGVRMHTPDKTARYENLVAMAAQEAMAGRPPLDGPLEVELEVRMPVPLSKPKRWRDAALAGAIRPTKKPDADNFAKGLDACNMIVWVDDAQIVDLHVKKIYHEAPAFVARVREIGSVFE